jgi:multidrug efflux pump
MLENIYAKIEDMHPMEGLAGSREVFFAIISTTVALIAVFAIVFLQPDGQPLKEFGIVVGGSVAISALSRSR